MLKPCPSTPNCVSTQATDKTHRIEPFTYRGSSAEAMARLAAVIEAMPRTKIVERGPHMLRAEFRTFVFRFVDDAVFVLDEERKTIEFRSASRLGRSDLGVNRRRLEGIWERFTASAL
ncbi:MAG TPA: DUF1499 domain-containing protein [Thermoanaerobaculia bacterium]|nr:DUF1499 domain-containing protein [Thermoanaerobaculia bacterium]